MTFSNAAHWPMYIHNKDTGEIRKLTVKGTLIGLNTDEKYKKTTIDIKKGERIVFFTDGIVEEKNINGKIFDDITLEMIIRENPSLSAEELSNEIFKSIYSWSESYSKSGLKDDATLLVIDII